MIDNNAKNSYKVLVRQTKRLVDLYLNTEDNFIIIGNKVGMSPSSIIPRLNSKKIILEAFPENGEEIWAKVQAKLNTKVAKKDKSMINMAYFAKDKKMQNLWLLHLALTFSLKPASLGELVGLSDNDITNILLNLQGNKTYSTIAKLIYWNYIDQDLAKNNLIKFYNEYLEALRKKDLEKAHELLSKVTDRKAMNIIATRKPQDPLSEDDILTILNYQLKYYLTGTEVCNIFNINRSNYSKRVLPLIAKDPLLTQRYEDLLAYIEHCLTLRSGNHGIGR